MSCSPGSHAACAADRASARQAARGCVEAAGEQWTPLARRGVLPRSRTPRGPASAYCGRGGGFAAVGAPDRAEQRLPDSRPVRGRTHRDAHREPQRLYRQRASGLRARLHLPGLRRCDAIAHIDDDALATRPACGGASGRVSSGAAGDRSAGAMRRRAVERISILLCRWRNAGNALYRVAASVAAPTIRAAGSPPCNIVSCRALP